MELTYVYKTQDKTKYSTVDVSEVTVIVDYTPEDRVMSIIDARAKSLLYAGAPSVDIASFLVDKLGLDGSINELTDWYALYHQTVQEEKEYAELSHQ